MRKQNWVKPFKTLKRTKSLMPRPGVLSSQICICFVTMSETHQHMTYKKLHKLLEIVLHYLSRPKHARSICLQSATSALRRRVLGLKGHKPAEQQHRLTHELSDTSNVANGRSDQAGEQELTDDPTTIVALLNVAGKLHTPSSIRS